MKLDKRKTACWAAQYVAIIAATFIVMVIILAAGS